MSTTPNTDPPLTYAVIPAASRRAHLDVPLVEHVDHVELLAAVGQGHGLEVQVAKLEVAEETVIEG